MRIHLLTSFTNAVGGSENRTLELYSRLRPHAEVALWSDDPPAAGFSRYPIRTIHPWRREFPLHGTLVILGPHTRIGQWLRHADIERTIVIANLYPYHYLFDLLEVLDLLGVAAPEIVYASEMLRREIGLTGTVEASPIDLDLFRPAGYRTERPFTVGRLSRDVAAKHHPEDPSLYRMLAAKACRIRIMGGSLFRGLLPQCPGIELLDAGAEPAGTFLRSLDCFFYRTSEQYREPLARVVLEAMACGLPVVCSRHGGHAEHVRHGENGLLVDSQEEAYDWLMAIGADRGLGERLGRAARETVEALYDDAYWDALVNFYLQPTPSP